MTDRVKKWLKGLVAAFVGGGATAVTSGLTTMGLAPDKFNLTDFHGVLRVIGLALANFVVSGLLSMFFYLRQSPVPPDSTGDTQQFTKPAPPSAP